MTEPDVLRTQAEVALDALPKALEYAEKSKQIFVQMAIIGQRTNLSDRVRAAKLLELALRGAEL